MESLPKRPGRRGRWEGEGKGSHFMESLPKRPGRRGRWLQFAAKHEPTCTIGLRDGPRGGTHAAPGRVGQGRAGQGAMARG